MEEELTQEQLEVMSIEELDSYLKKQEEGNNETVIDENKKKDDEPQKQDNGTSPEVDVRTNKGDDQNTEKQPDNTTKGENDEGKQEAKTTKTEETGETGETDEIENPFFRGKSKKELVAIIQNGTKKISEQGNQLVQFNQKLRELELKLNQPGKQEETDNTPYSDYDQNDITVIKKIIRDEQEQLYRERKEKEQQQKINIDLENTKELNDFKREFPELGLQIEKEIREEVKYKGVENTAFVPGYVKTYIYKKLYSNNSRNETRKNAIINVSADNNIDKRKAMATTAIGGQSQKAPTINKAVSQMTPEEYLIHLQSQGIHI